MPRWSVTPSGYDIRFEGVTDEQGHFYWVECWPLTQTSPVRALGYRCEVLSRTGAGLERFRTDVSGAGALRMGQAPSQLVTQGLFIFVPNRDVMAAVDVRTGALVWQRALSATIAETSSIKQLSADGHGSVYVVAVAAGEVESWSLVSVNAQTALREWWLSSGAPPPRS
jgi:hypothetical protein